MNYKQILGIFFIILGILFAVFPIYTSIAVSILVGMCLIAFGFVTIVDGFSIWSQIAHVSAIKILLGIIAIIFGFLFIFYIDALSFLIGLQFYIVGFIMIIFGVAGLLSKMTNISTFTSILVLIIGIIAIALAVFSLNQPIYIAILIGIVLIIEGVNLFLFD